MFTVKLIQAGVTAIRTVKEITIARPESRTFKEAKGYADEVGIKTPDYIEYVPEVGEPKDHTIEHITADDIVIIQQEQILENGERDGVDGDPIAVICEDSSAFFVPHSEAMAGVAYTFLYKGDEVYIMNKDGSTVEAVK